MTRYFYIALATILFTIITSCGPGSRTAETESPSICSTDSDCPTDYTCSSNVCVYSNSDGASCSADSDCSSGTCINGSCVTQSSLSQLSTYQTCEFFGYSTSNTSGYCENSNTSVSSTLASITSDATIDSGTTDWKSGSGYMRVSEGEALLAELGASNIDGSGVSVAIVGSGVNNVVSTDDDSKEVNIDTTNSADYGSAYSGTTTEGDIYYDIVRKYPDDTYGIDKNTWRLESDDSTTTYSSYANGSTGTVCDSDNTTDAACATTIYVNSEISANYTSCTTDSDCSASETCSNSVCITTGNSTDQHYLFRDRDYLTVGAGDVAQGTTLASIIAKDSDTDMKGIVGDAEVVSVKTQFTYRKTNYWAGEAGSLTFDIDNDDSFILEDNSGKVLYDAVVYAKSQAEVVLFNNHERQTSNDHLNYFKRTSATSGNTVISCDIDGDGIGCDSTIPEDVRSFERINDIATNAYFANVKTELNDSDQIYIVPVANTELSSLIASDGSDSNEYNTLLAVADVTVTDVNYCSDNSTSNCAIDYDGNGSADLSESGQDEYSTYGIQDMTISGFKTNSAGVSHDCSSIVSAHCVIAPGSFYALQSDGSYSTIDSDEYAGSAYVAGIIAKLRGTFSTTVLSNEDIISKIIATATDPAYISGCDTSTGDCGSGMINFYEVLLAVVDDSISVSSVSGSSFVVDSSNISLSGVFGDGFSSSSASILGQAVFFDDYNFAYNAKLAGSITKSVTQSLLLETALGVSDYDTKSDSFSAGDVSFDLTTNVKNDNFSNRFTLDPFEKEVTTDISNLSFSNDIAGKVDYKVGFNSSYNNQLSSTSGLTSARGYASFYGADLNLLTAKTSLTDDLSIDGAFLSSDDVMSNIANLTYSPNANTKAAVSFGIMSEENSILGSTTSGAFGDNVGADTSYMNVQLIHNIGSIEFFGSASFGKTSVLLDNNSIITGMTNIKTEELQLSLSKETRRSKFGINYTEPLRVTGGVASITVPTSRDLNDNVYFTTGDVSLATLGKEVNYELFFTYDIDDLTSIEFNYVETKDVGHVKGEASSLVAVGFSKLF